MEIDTEASEGINRRSKTPKGVSGSGVVNMGIKTKDGEQEKVHYVRLTYNEAILRYRRWFKSYPLHSVRKTVQSQQDSIHGQTLFSWGQDKFSRTPEEYREAKHPGGWTTLRGSLLGTA